MQAERLHQARKGLRLTMALAGALLCAPILAQGTWTWQQQCSSNEWSAICYTYAGCGYDQNNNPVHRYFNNWGHSQCSVSPGLPGPGSIIIIPTNTNPLLASNVDIKSVLVSSGAVFDWRSGSLTLRDPANNNAPGTFTNQGLLRIVDNYTRYLSGLLVNSGTLVHQAGTTYFNNATLQNSGTLELQGGTLSNYSGANRILNTATLRKTTTNDFTIYVPLQTQNATMEVQAGTLSLTGAGDYRHNTAWSVASGASLYLSAGTTYTFTGTHSGAIAGTLVQTAGTVQAGSGGAIFNFTGNGFAWQAGDLNGGSSGLTNQGLLRIVGSYNRYLSGLLVNSGTLVHQAGTTYFNGATLQNSNLLELQAGGLYHNSGTNLILNHNPGTVYKSSTSGTFTISVPFNNDGGLVRVAGGTLQFTGNTINRGSRYRFDSTTATVLYPQATHQLEDAIVLDTESELGQIWLTSGVLTTGENGATLRLPYGVFQWQAGDINTPNGLTIASDGGVRIVGSYNRYLSGLLVNRGTLVHQAGETRFSNATLQNSGTLELQGGTLSNHSGANRILNNNPGTVYKSSTSGTFTLSVPFTNDGGLVRVAGGTLQFTGNTINRGSRYRFDSTTATVLYPQATHQLEDAIVLDTESELGQIWLTSGVLTTGENGATLRLPYGVFQWQAGDINTPNGLTIASDGGVRIVGSYNRYLSGLLVNRGTLVHQAGETRFSNATLQNSGTLELQGGALSNHSGANRIQNTATLRKTTTNDFTISVPLQTQNATMEVQAGTLSLTGAGDYRHNTAWSVASGASLNLSASTTYTFTGTHSGAIAGTLVQTAGTVQAGSGGAIFNFTGNGFAWQAGALNGGSDGLTNQGLLRIVGSYNRYLSGLLVNSGTLVHQAGETRFSNATLQNSGTLELQGGALSNHSGANRIQNTATLRKVSPNPNNPTSFTISVPTTNSGRIEVLSGTLSITNLTQTDGETRIHRSATLASSNAVQLQGGKLTGAGTLSAPLNNTAGTIAPGIDDPDNPDLNPLGILTVQGNLTLGADAVLEVELAGTNNSDPANPQYDQLVVSGSTRTVQLNGALRVKGRDGYVPNPGDAFDILVRSGSWNRSGSFAQIEVDPDTLPCIVFEVQYLSDRVRLVASIPSADINRDGCVDDADLLAVLFAFGQTGNGLPEDAVCDGVVDDADLLAVLFAFGQGC